MIEAELQRQLQTYAKFHKIWIAYSGGLDSTVLLHAARKVFPSNISLQPIHVNHGLSSNADKWVAHCRAVCEDLDLPLLVERVSVNLRGNSLEEAARKARYSVFRDYVKPGEAILLAHHYDDQIETVLMRMIRGGDLSLLSGIPESRRLGDARLFRPFLSLTRLELEHYARDSHLTWVEDESNEDLSITRNYMRHQVIPALSDHAKQVLDDLSMRTDRLFAAVSMLCTALLNEMLVTVYASEQGLSLKALSRLSEPAQKLLVRQWIKSRDLPQPSERVFSRIWSELIPASTDKQPVVQWGNVQARRYNEGLFIFIERAIKHVDKASISVPLASFPSDEKVFGKRKKDWWLELRVPPWRRGQVNVLIGEDGQPLCFSSDKAQ